MISILTIWNRVKDYAKKDQGGRDTVFDFNGKVNDSQQEALDMLLPFMETNDRVKEILQPFIEIMIGETDDDGLIVRPPGISKFLSMEVNEIACYPVEYNEIVVLKKIPQRKPSLDNEMTYYLQMGKNMQYYPEEKVNYKGVYISKITLAKLVMIYDEVNGEIIQSIDAVETVNLTWDENAYNLLLNLVLEKYGISSREMVLAEYAKLGVQTALAGPITNVNER
ncbi:hypothetical protein KO02_12260 [Sphingobacterium sp. ML3W]|uniref:hypothetical protein n=1 Tax=Sphingobacterium sp. ML3W TaxID=1538644 RepID=UPI0004F93322|nr:hypothetical protein [Sphingobacterium sp. ML3W]AIM37378.1 hypothetical protein KO02_12260 [Sphingobacterium sp. ML3W]